MNSIEVPPEETDVQPKESHGTSELFDSPPSNNYMKRQLQLAFEKFLGDHPGERPDHDKRNEIMFDWSDSPYSGAFSSITKHPDFASHPKFEGGIENIDLEDVEYWMKNQELPKA